MIQNNRFTSPEQRFFFPGRGPVEYHESLDAAVFPRLTHIPGFDHYAVARRADGNEYAAELFWGRYSMRPGDTLVGIRGRHDTAETAHIGRQILEAEEFGMFADECTYTPADPENTQVIVRVDPLRTGPEGKLPGFDKHGVAVLPYGKALTIRPSSSPFRISDIALKPLGFIDEHDKLVTWHQPGSDGSRMVDWCVAHALAQNNLEKALVRDALPLGGDLAGLFRTHGQYRTYLEYFDQKHETSFMPAIELRSP